ncbi:thioredoxin [uncultured Subdoligranulum sp.]|uniref:thioredoxin n=1 Tax=uncultured Subdoligranulum sp. TaxID=512298 RepID=UPI00320A8C4E
MVHEVHKNDLTQAQAADVAVLDFNATWCNPCRMLAPVLEAASEELEGKALFYGIDVDENPALAQQFGISSIPALVVLKNGQPVARQVGFMPKVTLMHWLGTVL